MTAASESDWWRRGVVYQVYVRSFADGNGDGEGDINGLRSRLDHLVSLGVDAIWLNPWYVSPLADGGYDVADYRNIEPRYGTISEAEALISECHARDIRVIADLVPNHTSSEHEWFKEALASPPGHPSRDRYIFKPGAGDGSEPPNNWQAMFGGSAWERLDDGDWYLHLFDVSQPDLNWENPEVLDEFDDIIRFWLDRGVDGLRIDVAHGMIKDPEYADVPDMVLPFSLLDGDEPIDHPHWDRDGVHEINRRWRSILDEYDGRMMVAEAWVHAKRLPLYVRPDEYHQSFNFELLETPWRADAFARVIGDSVQAAEEIGAVTTWVLSNHDVMRHATRYGLPEDGTPWRHWLLDGPHDSLDQTVGSRRARAAALITLSLPGSTYIYQGEELGLPEVWDLPEDVLDDPIWERSSHTEKGRDGCRVPIPWTTDGPSFGFGATEGWLPQPDEFGPLSVAAQSHDPSSTLALYRRAIAARKHLLGDHEGLSLLDYGPGVLAYERGNVAVVVNMTAMSVPLPMGELLLASTNDVLVDELPADTAVWMRLS